MKGFAAALRGVRQDVAQRLRGAVVETAAAVHASIVENSPVDSGTFLANNRVALNQRGAAPLSVADKEGAATIKAAEAVLKEYVLGDAVHLYNNVPYAMVVEEGGGKYAPAGLYRLGALRAGEEFVGRISKRR